MANDLIDEDYEGGSNGASITTANTTADALTGTTPTFSTVAHEGSLAANHNVSSDYSLIRYDHDSASEAWYVVFLRLTSIPTTLRYILSFYSAAGGTKVGDVRVNTDGTLTIRNNFSAAASTSTALATDTWHRIALHIQPNQTDGLRLKTYTGANVDGTTADEDVAGDSTVSATLGALYTGISTSSTWQIYIDHVQGSSTEEPGATVSDTEDPVAVVSLTAKDATFNSSDTLTGCTFDVTAAASTDNVGVTGYSWSDNSAGGSFSSTTVAAPTWTPPNLTSGPWTLTCTVSDAAANTDAAGVSVDVPSSGGGASPVAGVVIGVSGSAI